MAEATNTFLGLGTALVSGMREFERQEDRRGAAEDAKIRRDTQRQQIKAQNAAYEREYGSAGKDLYDQKYQALMEQYKAQEQQNKQIRKQLIQKDTNESLNKFFEDGMNPYHLNMAVNTNEDLKRVWNAESIEKFVPQANDPNDQMMLRLANEQLQSAGGKDVGTDTEEKYAGPANKRITYSPEEISKRFVKVRTTNGTIELRDIADLVSMTGYTRYLTEKQRKDQLAKLEVKGAEAKLGLLEAQVETEKTRPETEAAKLEKLKKETELLGTKPTKLTDAEKGKLKSDRVAELYKQRKSGKLSAADSLELKGYIKEAGGEKALETDTIKTSKNVLDSTDFLKKDPSKLDKEERNALDAMQNIKSQQIEKDKEFLNKSGRIVKLADTASTMTKDMTGFIDNIKVGAYSKTLEDTLKGGKGTAAYNQAMTDIRHLLFGSALTETEIENFNKSYGTTSDQLVPLLEKFKVSLESMQQDYNTREATTNNKYLYHKASAKDREALNQAIHKIDQRMDYVRMVSGNHPDYKGKKITAKQASEIVSSKPYKSMFNDGPTAIAFETGKPTTTDKVVTNQKESVEGTPQTEKDVEAALFGVM